jgi:hypothetical protein
MWILLLIIIAGVLALAFIPAFKGYRTVVLAHATYVIGAVAPFLTEVTGYLQGLDWREYILAASDRKNLMILAIPAGLGLLMLIMRYLTKGPVGEK